MALAGAKAKAKARDHQRSRSRNTTPSSVATNNGGVSSGQVPTGIVESPLAQLLSAHSVTYDDILERHGANAGIPDLRHLDQLAADLRRLEQIAAQRKTSCERAIERLGRRKAKLERQVQKERESQEPEKSLESIKKEVATKPGPSAIKDRRPKPNRSAGREGGRAASSEERPLAHGAHALAPQDGSSGLSQREWSPLGRPGAWAREHSPTKAHLISSGDSTLGDVDRPPTGLVMSQIDGNGNDRWSRSPTLPHASSPMPDEEVEEIKVKPESPASNGSTADRQPPPAPSMVQPQPFGPDPSTYDDPTIYHIRTVTPGMSEEEIKDIYSVAQYPHDDLHDLVPGTPPDEDLSNAKPPNQVNSSTFNSYLEAYYRGLTEEDLAFLRERGDRTRTFVTPRRGKRHYTEIWTEEDGTISSDAVHVPKKTLPSNQARGTIEQLNDETAESDHISSGPLLSRLMAAMRPENRSDPSDDRDRPVIDGLTNGEVAMHDPNGEHLDDGQPNGETETSAPPSIPPATLIPDGAASSAAKGSSTKLDYGHVDERVKHEARFLAITGEDSEPDFDAHHDDEIASRLRYLQAELKDKGLLNGARKARLAEIAKERLAHQEYTTILEDLDHQVQQAYLRRTKSLGNKKRPQKKPGGAGGGSHYVRSESGTALARPGLGDVAKTLMERRRKWRDCIAPVFEDGITRIPKQPIFGSDVLADLITKEHEGWDEAEE